MIWLDDWLLRQADRGAAWLWDVFGLEAHRAASFMLGLWAILSIQRDLTDHHEAMIAVPFFVGAVRFSIPRLMNKALTRHSVMDRFLRLASWVVLFSCFMEVAQDHGPLESILVGLTWVAFVYLDSACTPSRPRRKRARSVAAPALSGAWAS